MVTKCLTLLLSPAHNVKPFTNLWHFWESIYEYTESVVGRCSKKGAVFDKTLR